ncbi:MAG: UvrD-helicase domain-containing protein [Spirochaetes bacterium]|nr:UvrD-helicase domain-containing protein [Spirochaetota bacterium]
MKFIADLHIHSRFSRATSKENNIFTLYKYSKIKGINLLGTGDFTHPGWVKELEEYLEEDGNGLLDLKKEYKKHMDMELPHLKDKLMKFIFSVEISSIYKKKDQVRKIHNVVFFPDFASVKKFNERLNSIGNIKSDGRPILGLDSRTLLDIALDINPEMMLIPAHIWTPWFSLFGMKSGFNTIEECFDDLTNEIFALETGLSSDPAMNWRLSALDKYNLVSNSDAHSPDNLAREANLFNTEMNYFKIRHALKDKKSAGFLGTIEFFPEEGKYHYDGHRNCNCRLTPKEALKNNLKCPVCSKPVTVGVLHRVEELADRKEGERPPLAKDFKSIIPLREIIGDVFGMGKSTKKVAAVYDKLLYSLENEMYILGDAPLEEIRKYSTEIIAEGIKRVREGKVKIMPGYDGEYGKVIIFSEEDRLKNMSQSLLLSIDLPKKKEETPLPQKKIKEQGKGKEVKKIKAPEKENINKEQVKAAQELKGPVVVLAGPGTGKTHTLIQKIIYLIKEKDYSADELLVITFTNKAADEVRSRLQQEDIQDVYTGTFHNLALNILRENNFDREIFDEDDSRIILKEVAGELKINFNIKDIYNKISRIKGNMGSLDNEEDEFKRIYEIYQAKIDYYKGMDYEDIIIFCYRLLEKYPDILNKYRAIFKYILVDEFQDVNRSQYAMIKSLSDEGRNLFVIGDPDQSIYKFRGSDTDLIYRLMDEYADHQRIMLKKNYRNPENIIKAGIDVISSGSRILKKYSDINILKKSDVKIETLIAPSQLSASIQLAKTITKYVGGSSMTDGDMIGEGKDLTFKDFAILVRIASQIPILEETLLHEGLPYKVIGDRSVLDNKFIRLAINIMRLKVESFNNFRFFNIIESVCFGISAKAISSLKGKLSDNPDIDMFEELRKEWKSAKNSDLNLLYEFLKSKIDKNSQPRQFFDKFPFTFFKEEEFDVLLNISNKYKNIGELLQVVLIGNEQDLEVNRDKLNKIKDIETISILTLHSAKGLEFPIVFIFEPVEGLMPFSGKETDLDEERRLFYVGMTRAMSKLIFIIPKKRKQFGTLINSENSRFINDINKNHIERIEVKFDPKQVKDKDQLTLF